MTDAAQEALRAGLAEAPCIKVRGAFLRALDLILLGGKRDGCEAMGAKHPRCILAYLTSHRAEVLAALGMEQVGISDDTWVRPLPEIERMQLVDGLSLWFAPKETTTLGTPEQTEEGKS